MESIIKQFVESAHLQYNKTIKIYKSSHQMEIIHSLKKLHIPYTIVVVVDVVVSLIDNTFKVTYYVTNYIPNNT